VGSAVKKPAVSPSYQFKDMPSRTEARRCGGVAGARRGWGYAQGQLCHCGVGGTAGLVQLR
jgi:hypothetical protein